MWTIKELYDNLECTQPLKIHPSPNEGFSGYLLRCKSLEEEFGHDTLLIKEPTKKGYTCKRLSDDRKERVAKRKEWYCITDNGYYACVNIECTTKEICDEIKSGRVSDKTLLVLSKEIADEIIEEWLPSFELYAGVWHLKQIKERDDKIIIEPPHLHLLFRRFKKRITPNETKLIVRGYY